MSAEIVQRVPPSGGDKTRTGLKDLDFRIGRYGRLEFMREGEEYAIHYMPVGMQTIESPPEFMIAQMLSGLG